MQIDEPTVQDYERAITTFFSKDFDANEVIKILLTSYPNIFLACLSNEQWKITAKTGNKLQAIKEYRARYNTSLLDAKHSVEAYINVKSTKLS